MNILFTGYFGAGNLGDDLMLESTIESLLTYNPNCQIGIVKLYKNNLNINLNKNVKVYNFSAFPGKLHYLILFILSFKYQYLLWIGGTCFTDEEGDGLYYLMNFANYIKMKIGYIAIGIGTLKNLKRIETTKKLLDVSSLITVRDKRSLMIIKDLIINDNKLMLTEDLVYLSLDLMNIKRISSYKKSIVISWRELNNYCNIKDDQYRLIEELIYGLKGKIDYFDNIYIIPLDDLEDVEKNQYIYDRLKQITDNVTFLKNLSANDKAKYIANCDFNISGRLHGVFISEFYNINTISLNYSNKMIEFLKSIDKEDDGVDVYNISSKLIGDRLNAMTDKDKDKDNIDLFSEKIKYSKLNIELLSNEIIKN